jgi:hypothetical protein
MLEWLPFGFVYTLLKDGIGLVRRGFGRKMTPQEKVELRLKWKNEFEPKIWEKTQKNLGMDCIIRDMRRIDGYPDDFKPRRGISPWFKAGLMSTYHNGIEVGLQWYMLTKDKNGWRRTDHSAGENGDVKTILIGYIPCDNIFSVDWNGDNFYGEPHIFCYFDAHRGQPYASLAYCTEEQNSTGPKFYMKVADAEEVRKNSKKAGIK